MELDLHAQEFKSKQLEIINHNQFPIFTSLPKKQAI